MEKIKEYLKNPFKDMCSTYDLVLCSLLIALSIVFSVVLSFYTSTANKFSLTFLFTAIIAAKYGPFVAGASAAITDIIQYFLKPQMGPFQPLLTLSAALVGITFGIILYKNKTSIYRIITARTVTVVLFNIFLDTYFISILYGKVFTAMLVQRTVKHLIMLPFEIILLKAALYTVDKIQKRSNRY